MYYHYHCLPRSLMQDPGRCIGDVVGHAQNAILAVRSIVRLVSSKL